MNDLQAAADGAAGRQRETGALWRRLAAILEAEGSWGGLLLATTIVLAAIGSVFVFSASFYHFGVDGDAYFYIRKQLFWLVISVLAGLLAYHFDYRLLARNSTWLLAVTFALLLVVLVPGVGLKVNESRRWLGFGGMRFQPSELAKLAMLVFTASYFSRAPERLRRFWRGYVPLLGVLLGVVVLVLIEPDFGTASFILGVSVLVMVVAGVRKRYLLASVLVVGPVLAGGAALRWELVRSRFLGFLDPEKLHQVKHSLLALGNGGLSGLGLGSGTQKLKFLPEPYTDFILAVVGEEWGLLGSWTVIGLFVVLLWAGVAVARRSRDDIGFVLGAGIALSLGLQAATNIAVVTASVPTKGIPLPFLTFGGSGLLMALAQIGILLSIDRVRRLETAAEGEMAWVAGEVSTPPAAQGT